MSTSKGPTVHCDRCHTDVEGFLPDAESSMSGGVYIGWHAYMNDGELVICDRCMWSDERFLKDYPYMRGAK